MSHRNSSLPRPTCWYASSTTSANSARSEPSPLKRPTARIGPSTRGSGTAATATRCTWSTAANRSASSGSQRTTECRKRRRRDSGDSRRHSSTRRGASSTRSRRSQTSRPSARQNGPATRRLMQRSYRSCREEHGVTPADSQSGDQGSGIGQLLTPEPWPLPWKTPVANVGRVIAQALDVLAVLDESLAEGLLRVGPDLGQAGHSIEHLDSQVEAIELVQDHHVERRGGRALLLVTTDVHIGVIRAPIGQPMDQPRVAVIGEDDRSVAREQRVEIAVRETMWMVLAGLQAHQVNDVDDSHF